MGMGMVGTQVVLVLSLVAGFALALGYVTWRGHLPLLRRLVVPALGVVVLSVPDALLTLRGTWSAPVSEADPFIGAFLRWSGDWGLCLAFPAWVLSWTLVLDGLEMVSARWPFRVQGVVRCHELYIAYALAMGHLDGLTSWTQAPATIYQTSRAVVAGLQQHGPWPLAAFSLGYVLYPALVFGAVATLAHLALRAAVVEYERARVWWRLAGIASSPIGPRAPTACASPVSLGAVSTLAARTPLERVESCSSPGFPGVSFHAENRKGPTPTMAPASIALADRLEMITSPLMVQCSPRFHCQWASGVGDMGRPDD